MRIVRVTDIEWRDAFAIALAFLAAFTDAKIGPIQLAEFFTIAFAIWHFLVFTAKRATQPTILAKQQLKMAMIFIGIIFIGAIIGFFNNNYFVPLASDSILKRPAYVSLARIVQIGLCTYSMTILIDRGQRSPLLLPRLQKSYIFGAVTSVIYGSISWLSIKAGIDLGGTYITDSDELRMRGFFVEGGPFGLYIATALVLLMNSRALYSKRSFLLSFAILMLGLSLSKSKAAFIAILLPVIIATMLSPAYPIRNRLKLFFAALVVVSIAFWLGDFYHRILGYFMAAQAVMASPDSFADNGNVELGRIAGSFIVPNMVMAHPLLGVGIGNYSLVRNDPSYRDFLPYVEEWDLHGLGLIGATSEIGIIGVLFFSWWYLKPYLLTRVISSPLKQSFLIFPLFAFIFGVQLTFVYPWIMFAIATLMSNRELSNHRAAVALDPAA